MDTSAWFAFFNTADANYQAAQAIMARLTAARSALVTTNFVRAETHALFLIRVTQPAGMHFLRSLASSRVEVIRATAVDEGAAQEIIFRYSDKRYSMTDAISFAVMGRLGLNTAFAFDRNFIQFGWTVLLP